MKKTLVFIVILFAISANSNSQPPAPGSNLVNNNLNKFEGTWVWTHGGKTVTIKLVKVNKSFGNYSEEVLLGVHKFENNGTVVEDNLNNFSLLTTDYEKSSILLYQNPGMNTSKVKGSIDDLTKEKANRLALEYVASMPNTLIWHMEVSERTTIDPNFQYGTTLPNDFILTKQ